MAIKIIEFLKKYKYILFLLFIFLTFSKPYIIDGKIPYPSSHLVTLLPPWNSMGQFSVPVKNNAVPDVLTQLYPWKNFTISELKEGRLPLWNPYAFSGTPHLANYQTAVFSITNIFFFILPFIDAWTVSILIQPLLMGIGTFFFLRKIKVSSTGSLIGSITSMFCGFMVVWMAYGTLSLTFAFLPFLLFLIESFLLSKKIRYVSFLSICVAFTFFAGHFQTALYVVLLSEIYAVYRIISLKKWSNAFYLSIGFLIGIFISLLQIYPTLLLFKESLRGSEGIVDRGIPFFYLITSVIPDFFGNPVTRNDYLSFYAERASFIGIIPYLLSLFAIIYNRSKQTLFFLIVGLTSLLLAIDSPLQLLLSFSKIPVLSSSNPTRIILLFSFSFAVLSALGYDTLLKLIKDKKLNQILKILIPYILLLSSLFIFLFLTKLIDQDKLMVALRNSVLPMFSLFSFSILILCFYKFKNINLKNILIGLTILLISLDSLRFAIKWMPIDSKSNLYPEIKIIDALIKERNNGRVFQALGAESTTYYKLQNIEGYDSLFLGRYAELIQSAKYGTLQNTERTTVRLDRDVKNAKRALDLLNVTTIFHPVSFNNQKFAYPVWEDPQKYKQIYKDDYFELYRNTKTNSRLKLFYNFEVIEKKEDRIKRLYSKDFDISNTLILEKKIENINSKKGEGKATIIFETPTKVVIKTESSENAVLFLSDPYFSKWKAKVNNNIKEILIADHAFRGVEVPKGESTIEFFLPFF